jgi:hypothetical protein
MGEEAGTRVWMYWSRRLLNERPSSNQINRCRTRHCTQRCHPLRCCATAPAAAAAPYCCCCRRHPLLLLLLLRLSDTTLAELNSSLVREEEGLVACRGLVATRSGSPSQGLLANELNDNQVCCLCVWWGGGMGGHCLSRGPPGDCYAHVLLHGGTCPLYSQWGGGELRLLACRVLATSSGLGSFSSALLDGHAHVLCALSKLCVKHCLPVCVPRMPCRCSCCTYHQSCGGPTSPCCSTRLSRWGGSAKLCDLDNVGWQLAAQSTLQHAGCMFSWQLLLNKPMMLMACCCWPLYQHSPCSAVLALTASLHAHSSVHVFLACVHVICSWHAGGSGAAC